MGKTFSTGLLTNGIWQDASNNIGIGGSPSGSYKFDVTGTGRFTSTLLVSGAATLSSTLGVGTSISAQNGGTYAGSAEFAGILRIQGTGGRYFTTGNGLEMSFNSIYSYNRGTNAYNDLTLNDSITVKGGGNVGIGTSSPLALLDVCVLSSGARRLLVNYADSIVTVKSSNDSSNGENLRLVGDNIIFNSGSSGNGSERMRITSAGLVGVGVSPDGGNGIFDVVGFSSTMSSTVKRVASFYCTTAENADRPGIILGYDTNGAGVIGARTQSTGQPLAFWTYNGSSWGERMRITSGGFTKISNSGTYATTNNVHEIRSSTSNDYALLIGNTSASPYGVYINYPNASPNSGSTNEFLICGDSTNTKVIIWANGTIVNRTGSYGTISDISLKENIVDANPKLNDLLQLKVRNFNFIGEDLKQIGFIAQEMEEVFPNMVDTDKEGLKSVKTSVLIPMLVKAIQELNAKVSALENKS